MSSAIAMQVVLRVLPLHESQTPWTDVKSVVSHTCSHAHDESSSYQGFCEVVHASAAIWAAICAVIVATITVTAMISFCRCALTSVSTAWRRVVILPLVLVSATPLQAQATKLSNIKEAQDMTSSSSQLNTLLSGIKTAKTCNFDCKEIAKSPFVEQSRHSRASVAVLSAVFGRQPHVADSASIYCRL